MREEKLNRLLDLGTEIMTRAEAGEFIPPELVAEYNKLAIEIYK